MSCLGVDERTARVAGLDGSASRSITESTDAQLVSPAAWAFDTMPLGERVLGIAEREASGAHLEAGIDLAVVPVEERIAVALEIDDREIAALRDAEHLRAHRLVAAAHEDLEVAAGDDVVVRHRDAALLDDEAAARACLLSYLLVRGERLARLGARWSRRSGSPRS